MTETQEKKIPDGFSKIVNDFTSDILITFPEYKNIISQWMGKEELLFNHCSKVFPERFFDILNKNADIFSETSTVNTEFLPGIVFKYLWKCEITDNTRETIWKYLQLILFSIFYLDSNSDLSEASKMFDNMDESVLKSKLEETMAGMQTLFENQPKGTHGLGEQQELPTNDDMKGIMNGKLGKLAMEFAEETAHDLNLDMDNTTSSKDVFDKIFKNPGNLMNVMKNVGDKMDKKIKSGELSESEIITEGMDILNKMKNMPGMEHMQDMFSKMGLGKNAKMNMGAMESQMQQNLKMAQMKERMKKKAQTQPQQTQHQSQPQQTKENRFTDDELAQMFKNDEPEKDKKDKKKKKTKK